MIDRVGRILNASCVCVVAMLGGCAAHVIPPVAPVHATPVYLCDYGIHSSLLLPNGDGRYVEYVYGDWDYAALNKTSFYYTLQALFFSPQPAARPAVFDLQTGRGFSLSAQRA